MGTYEKINQSTKDAGWETILTLDIFTSVGAFFFRDVFTTIKRGRKEEG